MRNHQAFLFLTRKIVKFEYFITNWLYTYFFRFSRTFTFVFFLTEGMKCFHFLMTLLVSLIQVTITNKKSERLYFIYFWIFFLIVSVVSLGFRFQKPLLLFGLILILISVWELNLSEYTWSCYFFLASRLRLIRDILFIKTFLAWVENDLCKVFSFETSSFWAGYFCIGKKALLLIYNIILIGFTIK